MSVHGFFMVVAKMGKRMGREKRAMDDRKAPGVPKAALMSRFAINTNLEITLIKQSETIKIIVSFVVWRGAPS